MSPNLEVVEGGAVDSADSLGDLARQPRIHLPCTLPCLLAEAGYPEPLHLDNTCTPGEADALDTIAENNGFVPLPGMGLDDTQSTFSGEPKELCQDGLASDDDGDTALQYAAFGNQPPIMEMLLKVGANINAVNRAKCTALHVAVNKQHTNYMRVLLKFRTIIINIQDTYGDTASRRYREGQH
ncbi:hypothetical protein MTO96_016918 [Rhipicephalus appendiculatus]